MTEVRQLHVEEGERYLPALAAVLMDCVDGNASVSFMSPLLRTEAELFFADVLREVEKGNRILLAAFTGTDLVGTVQIVTKMPPNQPHRADVAKLLVSRAARGQGIATLLMKEVEETARSEGKSLLVLDTCAGGVADRMYQRMGWTRAGEIPKYALYPDGAWCDTAIFWKRIG